MITVDGKKFDVVNPGTEHEFIKGCFGNRYHDACANEARKHRNEPCPPELARTTVIDVDGFKCKVYFNYVPPYGFGARPLNVWWGFAEIERGKCWSCPLNEEVKTLEDACSFIRPLFTKAIEGMKERLDLVN